MDERDADIFSAWILGARIGARGIGSGQRANARLAPQSQRGALAIADIEPEKESALRPIEAKSISEQAFGDVGSLGVAL